MQKTVVATTFLCFIVVLVTSAIYFPLGVGKTHSPQDQISQVRNSFQNYKYSNLTNEWLIYKNPDYHIKINYPSFLNADETNLHANQVVKFTIPSNNIHQLPDVEISIYVRSGLSTNATISDFVHDYHSLIYQSTVNGIIRPVSYNISHINGNEVIDQVYYDYSNDRTMKLNTINIIKDGELFSLFYIAQPGSFNQYINDFRNMVDSFVILPEKNTSLISILNNIDKYSHFFASITEQAAKLTGEYQKKIGEFQEGKITNTSMSELTSIYLKNFTNQLEKFEQIEAPKEFKPTKANMSNSFKNEIKSYQLFKDYLLTGNETKNQISTEFLSRSLEDELDAFRSYKDVVNGTFSESIDGLSSSIMGAKPSYL